MCLHAYCNVYAKGQADMKSDGSIWVLILTHDGTCTTVTIIQE